MGTGEGSSGDVKNSSTLRNNAQRATKQVLFSAKELQGSSPSDSPPEGNPLQEPQRRHHLDPSGVKETRARPDPLISLDNESDKKNERLAGSASKLQDSNIRYASWEISSPARGRSAMTTASPAAIRLITTQSVVLPHLLSDANGGGLEHRVCEL